METKQILELKTEIAKLLVEKSQMWDKVYRKENPSLSEREMYRVFSESCNKKIIDILPPDLVIDTDITGFCKDVDHYDIDKELEQHFPYLIADSESGGFFAYCNSLQVNEISDFLKQHFPTLSFKVRKRSDVSDFQNPFFPNSNYAYHFLNEIGVEMPDEVSSDKIPTISNEFKIADEIVEIIYSKYVDVSPNVMLKVIQQLNVKDDITELLISEMNKWDWEYLLSRKNESLNTNVQ